MAVVNISGSVWSSLHYDHSCCDGDQEGFLIGEVVHREMTRISDSQITGKTQEVDINVTSHCPCREPFSFYDKKGQIDPVKTLALLKSDFKNVIGFYRFRRNTVLQPSLREINLYQHLLAKLPRGSQPETFLLGIFSCSSSWNLATHSYPYQLFTYGYHGFSARKVSIVNLGDTAESEYKLSPVQSLVASSDTSFQQILDNYRKQVMGQDTTLSGIQTIQSLNTDVHNKLQDVKQKVCDTEGRLHQISQEVYELRRRAQRQRQERLARQKVAGQVLNANNNAGLTSVHQSTSNIMDAVVPVAMETNPTAATEMSQTATSNVMSKPNQHTNVLPQSNDHKTRSSQKPDSKDGASEEPMEVKSADPFAGLFKDMKQSISKSRSSSFNSPQRENSSVADSVNGADNRTIDSREARGKVCSDAGSLSSSQEGSQEQSKISSNVADDDDDDDATQIQDGQYYQPSLSPTF